MALNSVGIMSSAGIGRVLADWMIDERAPSDLWEVDVACCNPVTANEALQLHAYLKHHSVFYERLKHKSL